MALAEYLRRFTHLRTDRSPHWTEATRGRAPHKPLLLLAVLDLFAQSSLPGNLIELSPELGEAFALYWSRIMPPDRRGNIFLPFFHLRSSSFWQLLPRPGQEAALETIRQIGSYHQLQTLALGARLKDDLYQLLSVEEARNTLRLALIQTYFSAELQPLLLAQGIVNLEAFHYSQQLIAQARKQMKERPQAGEAYQPSARDQGFRRAVVTVYAHRCAFCGVRMITPDGHSVVEAAHIIPWRVSYNDDPHNGMALCRLCHWTFDEGLMAVNEDYLMVVSPELRAATNVPGHLMTLEARPLIGPAEQDLWPDVEVLRWHRDQVFCGA